MKKSEAVGDASRSLVACDQRLAELSDQLRATDDLSEERAVLRLEIDRWLDFRLRAV